jgi:hypothetical protein
LNWRHYAGAAAVLVILISLGAFLMMRGGSAPATNVVPATTAQSQPTAASATAPPASAATDAGSAGRVADVGNPPSGTQVPMTAPPTTGRPPDQPTDTRRVGQVTPPASPGTPPRAEKNPAAPAPETPKPVAGPPRTVAEPPKTAESTKAPAEGTAAPEARYSNVKWVVAEGDGQQEADVFLEFHHDTFTLKPANEAIIAKTLPYKAIVSLTYETRKPSGFGKVLNVFSRGSNNWLTVKTTSDTAVLHLDSKNYKTIMAAFETRTGLTVQK